MCTTCGCGMSHDVGPQVIPDGGSALSPAGDHGDHVHDPGHGHHRHGHDHQRPPSTRTLRLEAALLAKNDRIAAANRTWLSHRGIVALNLIGAPGAGKTSLLEATARKLAGSTPLFVIEGDQATTRDADRIRDAGAVAEQIITGTGCHLDAVMVRTAAMRMGFPRGALVFVENVGNLVCPALFDLGERAKVVVTSVTEGEDKPEKYPHVFRAATVAVLTKTDLIPHVAFDRAEFLASVRRVSPRLPVIETTTAAASGLRPWLTWLATERLTKAYRHAR